MSHLETKCPLCASLYLSLSSPLSIHLSIHLYMSVCLPSSFSSSTSYVYPPMLAHPSPSFLYPLSPCLYHYILALSILSPVSRLNDCDFEIGACGFANFSANSLNWVVSSGSTPSNNTGPKVDHTYGTKQGNYSELNTLWQICLPLR